MAIDYSMLSDEDLMALKNNDYANMSDSALQYIKTSQTQDDTMDEAIKAENTAKEALDIADNALGKTTLKGGVSKTNWLGNLGKGLLQGYTNIGVGIGKNITNKLRPLIGKEPYTPEELDKLYGFLDDKPQGISGNIGKFVGEFAPMLTLPQANIAKLGNLGNLTLNSAWQSGLIGGLNQLADKGEIKPSELALETGIGTVLPLGMYGIGKGIKGLINKQGVKNGIANILEVLTSVPSDYTERALNKELTGQSILKGKFDPKTAYHPIEKQLRQAKDSLPSKETFDTMYKNLGAEVGKRLDENILPESEYNQQLYDLGQKYIHNIEALENLKGADVSEALKNLPSDVNFSSAELADDVNKIFGQHSLSGNVELNPAINTSGRELQKINDLLYGSNAERVNKFKNAVEELKFPQINKEFTTYGANGHYGNIDTSPLNNALIQAERDTNQLLGNIKNKIAENPELLNSNTFISKLEDMMAYNLKNIPQEAQAPYFEKLYSALDKGSILDKSNMVRTPKQLYDINSNIKGMINWNDVNASEKNRALERLYGVYSNKLSELSPELKEANKLYSYLMDLEKVSGGINPTTIGGKLSNYGSDAQILAGTDRTLSNIDNLLNGDLAGLKVLPKVQDINNKLLAQRTLQNNVPDAIINNISKYDNAPIDVQNAIERIAPSELQQYKNLSNIQNANNEILNTIGKQYERNPRLLGNRNDIKFENALNELQSKSNINFMDELNDIRAREALEKFMPGQGGGSGSEQGFWNNVARPTMQVIPRSATAAILGNTFGGPIGGALGLLGVSPKFMAKGTIKNLGRLNNKTYYYPNLAKYLLGGYEASKE